MFIGEEITYIISINNNADVSGAFIILSSVKLRFTRIRVKLLIQRISTDPCSITERSGEGETEDYAISILCPQNANFPISFAN